MLCGVDFDGRPVGVVGSAVDHVVARQLHEADPDVCLDVLHHVSYMDGTVGVDEGGGHKSLGFGHFFTTFFH